MGESKIVRRGAGIVIKSVQRGTKSGLGQVTINSINTDRAYIILKAVDGRANLGTGMVTGEIVDSTTIEFKAFDADVTVVIDWEVIEYETVESVQRGTTTLNLTGTPLSTDITITEVDLNKAFVVFSNRLGSSSASGATEIFYLQQSAKLIDSTTLRLTCNNLHTADWVYHWQVIELN